MVLWTEASTLGIWIWLLPQPHDIIFCNRNFGVLSMASLLSFMAFLNMTVKDLTYYWYDLYYAVVIVGERELQFCVLIVVLTLTCKQPRSLTNWLCGSSILFVGKVINYQISLCTVLGKWIETFICIIGWRPRDSALYYCWLACGFSSSYL